MAIDYSSRDTVNALLEAAQEAEHDNREHFREVMLFLHKRDGQWEPNILNNMSGRPAYTFDKCNPIVDAISSQLSQSDFDIRVKPGGGDSTKDLAKTFDGIIRNIESMSSASDIYNSAAIAVVAGGLGGWRIAQDWVDSDSFDQDLIIKPISNYVDRVWFDPSAEMQDQSDAEYVFVLQSVSMQEYDDKFPEGSGASVGQDNSNEAYSHKAESVIVGEVIYKKPTTKTMVLMSNNAIYEVDDKFETIMDELAKAGVTETRRRDRDTFTVHQRMFDGSGWLTDEQETVFNMLPVAPMFANFQIIENKVTYFGAVDKLLDPQRVYNYARSRQIEEGALSPREKLMMTPEQAANHESTLATMNTNADPMQLYNHEPNQPAPYKLGGYNVNPGLETTAQAASADINAAAGQFGANLADNPGAQSGVALEIQTQTGNANNIKYFRAQEIAICYTAKVLIGAIPKVYDQQRQLRILNEDGSEDTVLVNEKVIDQQTGKTVMLVDLAQGKYDVTCKAGISFSNRQEETVRAFTEIAAVDPTVMQEGSDIFLNNITTPGMDLLAERRRRSMVIQGIIPPDQLTDEEQQMLQEMQQQQAQQQDQGDALSQAQLMLAQAEQTKAEADQINAQTNQQKAEIEVQEKGLKLNLESEKHQHEVAKFEQGSQLTQDKQEFDQVMQAQKQQMSETAQLMANLKTQADIMKIEADTFKAWREGQGVDVITGPHAMEATINAADIATQTQDKFAEGGLAGSEVITDL